jgi:acyl phosphate:glycerol-3-phosphate acyltransferase
VHPLLGLLISYLAGSIPFAYLAGKARHVDLRQHGSGNLGATNAMRVLGPKWGMLVYAGDTLKGAIPVVVLPQIVSATRLDLWAIAFGVAAIIGHVRPIFLMGQGGGKGVATTGGVFFGLAWLPTLIAFLSFAAATFITKRVSIGSITAAVILPSALIVERGFRDPLALICCAIAIFVIYLHRGNIARLRAGTEPRIGEDRETSDV